MSERDADSHRKTRRPALTAHVEPPWSVPVPIAEIPSTGRHYELTADTAARDAVAKAAGLVSVPRLEASFDLAPLAGDGVRVTGSVRATVEQHCVVTLDLMLNEITETVDLILVQPEAMPAPRAALDIDLAEESGTPDVLHDRAVDLGGIATEFLLLGIDPYPRKPGASFETPTTPANPADHPFAVLARLKNAGKPE